MAIINPAQTGQVVAGLWTPRDMGPAAAVSHTGDTTEFVCRTLTIQPAWIGARGRIRVSASWSCNASAGVKRWRGRIGGTGGTLFFNYATTTGTITGNATVHHIVNRSAAVQLFMADPVIASGLGGTTNAPATSAIDTSAAFEIVLAVKLDTSGADTAALESVLIETLYSA